jgi:ubiquinone/menaquinone biosynthesis C-methylase UbiE
LTTDKPNVGWDHLSHEMFLRYYAESSESKQSYERFKVTQEAVIRLHQPPDGAVLDVADIGCGAGTQCLVWAGLGHRVHGLDVNAPLIELATKRAAEYKLPVSFHIGTATELPWEDLSMDVCLVPELLEHVGPWKKCLQEFARILRPGGTLFLSTTNRLCPKQDEFNLFGYSWYPSLVKRHVVQLASTTKPQLANYATYPAVNWFTFYQLRDELEQLGLSSFDRFDIADEGNRSTSVRAGLRLIRGFAPVRFLAHVCTPFTRLIARKTSGLVPIASANARPQKMKAN